MSGFGIRRHNAGRAIVRFLIGLLVIAVCVLVLYEFVLNGDFSGLIARTPANTKPFVSVTQSPQETNRLEIIRGSEKPEPGAETNAPVSAPEDVIIPDVTAEPTAEPTATPEPTAEPTAAPTPIPENEFSKLVTDFGKAGTAINETNFKVIAGEVKNGLTAFEVSAPNEYKVITLTGWGYSDNKRFDGANCDIYIIVLNDKGAAVFYEPTMIPGVTGMVHEGLGKNLEMCEFTATIDVSDLPDGNYQLGVGVSYKPGSTRYRFAWTFGSAYDFTTVGGVVTAVGGVEVS